MRTSIWGCGFAVLSVPFITASADRGMLSGADLRQLLPNAVVHFASPVGSVVPVTYHHGGGMRGTAAGLEMVLGAAADSGRWWIKGSRLCQKWRVWFSGKPACYAVRLEGRQVYWSDGQGNEGTAKVVRLGRGGN